MKEARRHKKVCEECGTGFVSSKPKAIVCSKRCYNRRYLKLNRERLRGYAQNYYWANHETQREYKRLQSVKHYAKRLDKILAWHRSEAGRDCKRRSRIKNAEKRRAYNKKWTAENREKSNAKTRRWRAANRDLVNARQNARSAALGFEGRRAKKLKYSFGLTPEQFDAMHSAQGGKCAICGGDGIQWQKNSKTIKVRLAIDHCHSTGKVRGLLCHGCNTALGRFGDSDDNLLRAVQYLRGELPCQKAVEQNLQISA